MTIEVYAKYLDMRQSSSKVGGAALLSLMMQAASGTVVPGDPAQAAMSQPSLPSGAIAALGATEDHAPPRAFLNYLLFDNNFNQVDAGFMQVSQEAAITQENLKGDHEKLVLEVTVTEPGYLFTNLSHDEAENVDIYFDDFTITHEHGSIVQVQEYYPYGLTFNENIKANAVLNKYLYQGKERLEETGWQDFHARLYSPALGRFLGVDPQNQFASGFVGMGNNPINGIDPDGEFWHIIIGAITGGITNVAQNWDEATSSPWGWFKTWETGAFVGAAAAATGGAAGAAVGGGVAGGVVGGAAGGFVGASGNAWTNGANFGQGLQAGGYGAITGAVGGGLSAFGGGSFASNLAWGVGEGAATGALGAALYGGDIGQGALYGGIAGGVFATATSPQLRNALKGQGFRSNNKVLADFVARGNYQGALDYFGFEGSYNPAKTDGNPGATYITTGEVFYNDRAFTSYDLLAAVVDHEMFHRANVASGKYNSAKKPLPFGMRGVEEWGAYMTNYKNQGLYRNHGLDLIDRINRYGMQGGLYGPVITSSGSSSFTSFKQKWWHFIYRIPRRY